MALSAGDKLGPYEILAKIGAGGMGEVYRAHDPRLRRDVAIKVSAERFSERFEREAHAVAALNHPNICAIYDVGPNYIVMEYVEGEEPKGPLPLDEALRIARQIGDALEAAHEKGITHRDLKPGNIMLKPDGAVKVLDFGLAKQTSPVREGGGENSPTISMAATQVGMILGTAGYMSPEQARGKPVDKRADIWAFGVVFHELLTGRRVFAGEDISDTLAAVIKEEPKWDGVPPKVQRLLKKCLQKDPKNRLRDIGDAWELLEPAPSVRAGAQSKAGWIAAVVAVLIAAALGFGWWSSSRPVEKPLVQLDVDLGSDVSLPPAANSGGTFQISPDGTRLVYDSGTPSKLFIRRLDQKKSTELPGTSGAQDPFFSPDSQWVGFFANNKLNKISVEGGAAVPLGDAPVDTGGWWGEDGNIVFGQYSKGLFRIPDSGGTPTALTEPAIGESFHGIPQILPGGKAVLFSAYSVVGNVDKATIEVITLADHRRKVLVRGAGVAHYVASSSGGGHLLYTNRGTLFAVPFDLGRLETRGTAVPVVDDVAYQEFLGLGGFGVSSGGTLVYRRGGAGNAASMVTLQWLDSSGKKTPLLLKPGVYRSPRLSPDGQQIVFMLTEGSGANIGVYDIRRDAPTKLTSGGATLTEPVWSPDGKYVVFGIVGSGLFWTRSDGASQPQPLTQAKELQVAWSFFGKRLAYFDLVGAAQIFTVSIDDQGGQLKAGEAEQFFKSQVDALLPTFSPDGKWLAYATGGPDAPQIEVRAFPPPASGQGGKWLISTGSVGGYSVPVWSQTSRDLLYMEGDQIMAVSYTAKDDSFKADKPRVWAAKTGATWFDLAPDGKRALIMTPVAAPEAPKQEHEIVFIENFFDYLRQRVPLGK